MPAIYVHAAETRVAAPLQGDLMSGTNCSLNRSHFSFLLALVSFLTSASAIELVELLLARAASDEEIAQRRSEYVEEMFTVVMRFAKRRDA